MDVEPLLVPLIQRGVPGAVQVLCFHAVALIQVGASGYLRATAPFLPKIEQVAKEVKMGLEATIRLAEMDEGGDKENQVGMQIANCRRNMVGSLPRGMPKVVDYRQTDAQATNKIVTQDRHEVLSRFGRREGVISTSRV